MVKYSLAEAQSQLPELIERAGRGEAIVVANNQGVTVKLTVVESAAETSKRRRFGQYKGQFTLSEAIFEPTMSDEDYEAGWLSFEPAARLARGSLVVSRR
jgi:antitoxin (DNA-binding transcriptional repressor) of toxin-antitoxin stability system